MGTLASMIQLIRPAIFLGIVFLLSAAPHKYYISTCDIKQNSQEKTLQLTFKVFTHDLERSLEELHDSKLFLGTQKEPASTNSWIESYLNKHFQLKLNGKSTQLHWVGKEIEIHDSFIYLEIRDVEEVKSIEVSNDILVETFPEQQNIVNMEIGDQKASLVFVKDTESQSVDF